MKLELTFLLPLLSLASTSAIPSSEIKQLQKRRFNLQGWSQTNTWYRPSLAMGQGTFCAEKYVPVPKALTWPQSLFDKYNHKGYRDFDLCTFQGQMEIEWDCYSEGYIATLVRDQSDNDCPETVEAFVQRVQEASRAGKWNPPIGEEEAWEGARMMLPAEAFEQEVQAMSIPAMGMPNRTPLPPAAVQRGIKPGCLQWHVAKEGDSCYWLAHDNGIELHWLYEMNPALLEGGECAGLWLGYAYCLRVQ